MTSLVNDFASTTSIHGILYIGNKLLSNTIRFCWTIIFLSCLTLCVYQSVLYTKDYLEFRVKTSYFFEPINELQFPSITFCSPFYIKRSEVGNFSFAPQIIAGEQAVGYETNYQSLLEDNFKTCKSDHRTSLIERAETEGFSFIFNNLNEIYSTLTKTFESEIIKCWWRQQTINCSDVMINRYVDKKSCYTFNVGNEYLRFIATIQEKKDTKVKYKQPVLLLENWKMDVARFLVNINQSDYCGTKQTRDGAGLEAILTETNTIPLVNINTPIKLSPGYVHNIVVKPTLYRRNTEHLGNCSSNADLFFFPNSKKYVQGVCYIQCIIGGILKDCKCFPGYLSQYRKNFLDLRNKFGVPKSSIKACNDISGGDCAKMWFYEKVINNPIEQTCRTCKRQCFENRYGFRSSHTLLPFELLKEDLRSKTITFSSDESFLRKNFFYVSFSFDHYYAEVVEESQEILLLDVFIAYGSNIGLFLGMSFMSIFEIQTVIETVLKLIVRVIRNIYSKVLVRRGMKSITKKKTKKRRKKKKSENTLTLQEF